MNSNVRGFELAAPPVPTLAPAALLLLVCSGGAWSWLVHAQWFAAFDPGSLNNLCQSWASGMSLSPERLGQASRQWLFDGVVMVLAMMLPGAMRSSHGAAVFSIFARSHERGTWTRCAEWTGGYLVVWCSVLLVAACAMALVHMNWSPSSAASRAFAQAAPATLALLAGAVQMSRALAAEWQWPHAEAAPLLATDDGWWSGVSAGAQCVARCALPMIALHAVYGMSLAAMASYALVAWWRAGSRSPWPHAVAGMALICSVAIA
jgi:Predicted metal-binding integral membrane protein (DUF2182)